MIIGVWIFGQFTSSLLETSINDSFNVFTNKNNEDMINKLHIKYDLSGDSLSNLKMLVDSVCGENNSEEVIFINKLPKQLNEVV